MHQTNTYFIFIKNYHYTIRNYVWLLLIMKQIILKKNFTIENLSYYVSFRMIMFFQTEDILSDVTVVCQSACLCDSRSNAILHVCVYVHRMHLCVRSVAKVHSSLINKFAAILHHHRVNTSRKNLSQLSLSQNPSVFSSHLRRLSNRIVNDWFISIWICSKSIFKNYYDFCHNRIRWSILYGFNLDSSRDEPSSRFHMLMKNRPCDEIDI